MKLNEVPFDIIKVGDSVISVLGNYGTITKIIDKVDASQQEDNEFLITWDNGATSRFWHFWGTNVEYVGPIRQK